MLVGKDCSRVLSKFRYVRSKNYLLWCRFFIIRDYTKSLSLSPVLIRNSLPINPNILCSTWIKKFVHFCEAAKYYIHKIAVSFEALIRPLTYRKPKFDKVYGKDGPHVWSSGQSFWLQIQRSRVRFPALPDFSE